MRALGEGRAGCSSVILVMEELPTTKQDALPHYSAALIRNHPDQYKETPLGKSATTVVDCPTGRKQMRLFHDLRFAVRQLWRAPGRQQIALNLLKSAAPFHRARRLSTSHSYCPFSPVHSLQIGNFVSVRLRAKLSAPPARARPRVVFSPARRGSPRRARYLRRHSLFRERSRRRCGRLPE